MSIALSASGSPTCLKVTCSMYQMLPAHTLSLKYSPRLRCVRLMPLSTSHYDPQQPEPAARSSGCIQLKSPPLSRFWVPIYIE